MVHCAAVFRLFLFEKPLLDQGKSMEVSSKHVSDIPRRGLPRRSYVDFTCS